MNLINSAYVQFANLGAVTIKTSCLTGAAVPMLFLRPSYAGLKKSMGTAAPVRQDVFIVTGPREAIWYESKSESFKSLVVKLRVVSCVLSYTVGRI